MYAYLYELGNDNDKNMFETRVTSGWYFIGWASGLRDWVAGNLNGMDYDIIIKKLNLIYIVQTIQKLRSLRFKSDKWKNLINK